MRAGFLKLTGTRWKSYWNPNAILSIQKTQSERLRRRPRWLRG